jgi:hypothetical protein
MIKVISLNGYIHNLIIRFLEQEGSPNNGLFYLPITLYANI